jgi:hypothetical protein
VTATAVAIGHGAPAPSPRAVQQLTSVLDKIADAVQAGVAPSGPFDLPSDEALQPVTDAVRAVLGVMTSPKEPSPERSDRSGAGAARPAVPPTTPRRTG